MCHLYKCGLLSCLWCFFLLLFFVDVCLSVLCLVEVNSRCVITCRSVVWQQYCYDGYTRPVLKSFGLSFLQNHKLSWKKELLSAYRMSRMQHLGKRFANVVRSLHATCWVSADEQLSIVIGSISVSLLVSVYLMYKCICALCRWWREQYMARDTEVFIWLCWFW